ncbi:YiiX/YebB-like N1pC/P60 family cysteine hydrolase [Pontiellaceae bacterium B12219]|nr:YiiX/YebB-like N1pC/P60 family cysteine hydrolase [Pontiellaceae bacterium B12219]
MINLPRAFFSLLITVFLLCFTGCSTTKHKEAHENWIDLFTPSTNPVTLETYTRDQLQLDYTRLNALTLELDQLAVEAATLRRTLLFQESPYISDVENKEIELMLFRFQNALDSLLNMADYYRLNTSPDLDVHTRGGILGMNAALKHTLYSSRFVSLFHDKKELIGIINTAHPSYDIPAGFYDSVAYNVTTLDALEQFDISWALFCKDLANPESPLSKVKATDPVYGKLMDQMDELHATAHIQMEYLLYAQYSHYPELKDRIAHSRISRISKDVSKSYGSSKTATRGFIFKNVARMKSPTAHILTFSGKQADEIKAMLQPGDILLTYTAGYMSDVFLPGSFKHGITYIGTVEERRKAGLTDDFLKQHAISEKQADALIEHVNATTTPDGYQINIVEAVAEGVVLHSLDKLLETHINRLVAIRPNITPAEQLNQLLLLMQYVGAPYDFKFDFQNDAYQCCTEVVYRITDQKGTINYSLVEMKGRWILAADDILRYYLTQNPAAFDFVFLADQSSDPKNFNAVIHSGPKGLDALYELMDVTPPVQ